MAEQRLTGTVDMYHVEDRYGIIRDESGERHFAHYTNIRGQRDLWPGMQVSFLSRTRTRGKGRFEAYDVEILKPTPTPTVSQTASIKPSSDTEGSTQKVAQEALRRKIARRRGTITQPVEKFPVGTRVYTSRWGYGKVELASARLISVRLEDDPSRVVDVPRSDVRLAADVRPGPTAGVREAPAKPQRVAPTPPAPLTLDRFLNRIRGDVQEVLAEEGLDTDHVYSREESRKPHAPPAPLQISHTVSKLFEGVEDIADFYSHQIEVRQHLLAGKHIMITTPTASGKTESYNPTILETLLSEPRSTALYIFPLVALGEDQVERLRRLNNALPHAQRLEIGIYNSNVDPDEKKATLYADNRILVTTPDSLHYIFLPKPYPNWKRFYANLRYVVLDEAHVYRGVLGANMANIVRRLLVRCRREGNPDFPQLIISSATVRSPRALAHQLTGLPKENFAVVDKSGAPQLTRHLLVTREDVHDLVDLCADLLELETVDARTGQSRPVRTIVFLRSINAVKGAAEHLRKQLRSHRKHDLTDTVADFYSERANKRDIFIQLREGKIRCIFTTTALMAGIDIGSLDVALVRHFPGLVMDARQMFGRAGRAGEGAAIFIARRTDPFDQFYFERPDLLFTGETEEVIANPENPYLLAAHLKCAAQTSRDAPYNNREGPLPGRWTQLFGEMGQDLLNLLERDRLLVARRGNYELLKGAPHDEPPLDNLRSMETDEFILVTESLWGMQELEKKRASNAYRDAHPDAIVWCDGKSYKVVRFDQESREILCRPEEDSNLRTRGIQSLEIEKKGDVAREPLSMDGIQAGSGEVSITTGVEKYALYRSSTMMRCRNRSCRHETTSLDIKRCPRCGGPVRARQVEKIVETVPIASDIPLATTLETRASWLQFPTSLQAHFEREFWPRWMTEQPGAPEVDPSITPSFEEGVHSLLHGLLKAFPERVRCDRDEINGLYGLGGAEVSAEIYVYDNFPGGLGLADEFYFEPESFMKDGLEIIERCNCDEDDGCPVCLNRFGCHVFNAHLSKFAGRYLFCRVLGISTDKVIEDLKDYVYTVIDPSLVVGPEQPEELPW